MTEKIPQLPTKAVSDAPTELALEHLVAPRTADPASADPAPVDPAPTDPSGPPATTHTPTNAPTLDLVRIKLATLTEATPDAQPQLRDVSSYVGLIIDGRYHIESIIAQGGMGMVYKARHRLLDKLVAVKVLRPELVNNHDITRRFLTEAQAASAIGSEHIVDVTDFGELPDGATYIIMEYLDGVPLSQLLKPSHPRLTPSDVLVIARQLTEGLEQAHLAQIVHRDLKPDNILLIQLGKRERFVKILDFGIAKMASSQNETTRAGKIFGTPHYMSPEQARGESLDARTDIYSLGVMLYEMLTGQLPFAAENPLGVLTQHMYVEPPLLAEHIDPNEISLDWEAVVAKCLSKEATRRYDSMATLEADLGRLSRGEPSLALKELRSLPELTEKLRNRLGVRRSRQRVGHRLLLACALCLGAGLTAWTARQNPEWMAWVLESPLLAGAKPAASKRAAANQPQLATIDVVLSPIDAHVFQGKLDLGTMPIRLRVRKGQRTEISVQRSGYKTQRLIVDGTQPRIQVELRAIAGAVVAAIAAAAPADFAVPRTVTLSEPSNEPEADERAGAAHDAGGLAAYLRPFDEPAATDTLHTPGADTSALAPPDPGALQPEQPSPKPPGPPPRETDPTTPGPVNNRQSAALDSSGVEHRPPPTAASLPPPAPPGPPPAGPEATE